MLKMIIIIIKFLLKEKAFRVKKLGDNILKNEGVIKGPEFS